MARFYDDVMAEARWLATDDRGRITREPEMPQRFVGIFEVQQISVGSVCEMGAAESLAVAARFAPRRPATDGGRA